MTAETPPGAEVGRDFVNFSLSVAFYAVCAPMIAAAHLVDTVFRTRSFDSLVRLVEAVDNGHHAREG